MEDHIKNVAINASDPGAHFQLADIYAEQSNWIASAAEYRTSMALGNKCPEVFIKLAEAYLNLGKIDLAISICDSILSVNSDSNIAQQIKKLTDISDEVIARPNEVINHNAFFRLKTLSDYLNSLSRDSCFSVLDVGGGLGYLSLFLPQADYVLAEPGVNGICGSNLPFKDKFFDFVIACHVLEHIPVDNRVEFLEQLCKKAKRSVILLNPFVNKNNDLIVDAQKLIYQLTGAVWAKEHMECTLPRVEDVQTFAQERNIKCRVIPNGSKATTIALVFLDYFVGLAGRADQAEQVYQLLNRFQNDEIVNDICPNGYLVELDLGDSIYPQMNHQFSEEF